MTSTADWNLYQRERYAEHRAWAMKFLGGKCAICGTKSDLQFDHEDPKLKKHSVSAVIRGWSIPRVAEMLVREKVRLLCGKHHREKSLREYFAAQRLDNYPEDGYTPGHD